jgi:MFS family permease
MNDFLPVNSSLTVTVNEAHGSEFQTNSSYLSGAYATSSEFMNAECSVKYIYFFKYYFKTKFTINSINFFKKNSLNWSKQLQGLILSSVYIGYILSQIVGSWLGLLIGAKSLLFLATIISSVLSILTPVTANYGYIPLIALRFTLGLAQVMFEIKIFFLFEVKI